jgi:hypothetical protein
MAWRCITEFTFLLNRKIAKMESRFSDRSMVEFLNLVGTTNAGSGERVKTDQNSPLPGAFLQRLKPSKASCVDSFEQHPCRLSKAWSQGKAVS